MIASMRLARSIALITVLVLTACARETLVGTDLGTQAAPDFTLTDAATGQRLTFSQLQGSVVALAFLYTRCPDTCPLTAEHFRDAQQRLGADADRVRFVAVSVDPDGDTPERVRDFSAAHRLSRNWHYLIGTRAVLAPVWAAYGIRSEPDPTGIGVGHTDAIYVIDAKGNARVVLHTEDGPEPLAKDIKILLKER